MAYSTGGTRRPARRAIHGSFGATPGITARELPVGSGFTIITCGHRLHSAESAHSGRADLKRKVWTQSPDDRCRRERLFLPLLRGKFDAR